LTELYHRHRWASLLLFYLVTMCSCTFQPEEPGETDPSVPDEIRLICDQDYMAAFTELVASARTDVLIVQWEFFGGEATAELLEVLAAAVERGIHVQVLLDDDIEENSDAIQWMTTRGIDARLDDDTEVRLHAKMIIVDSERVLLGSTNWSNSSIRNNRECNLLADRPDAAAYLTAWYQGLNTDPGNREPPTLGQSSTDFTALVDDALLTNLLARIEAAQSRIDFTLYATWLQPNNSSAPAMQLFEALTSASARGVTVRGIADYSDWNHSNNESNEDAVQWLRARGVEVRWEDAETTTHAKIFHIDDGLQVQSANISSGGFRWNREVAAWTSHDGVIEAADLWFDNLWSVSTLEIPDR